jgi:K+-sensing histidine kinase KdpD
VEFSARPASDGYLVTIAVRDTGIGIPEEKLEVIFDPFVQHDPSVHERYGGTGLGLAITRKLVRLMGGELSVHSSLGEGSSFVIELPRVQADSGRPGEGSVSRPDADKRNETERTQAVMATDDPAALGRLRSHLGDSTLESWRRLFRVKMLDELARMAQEIEAAARTAGASTTADVAARLADAARRFDVALIDELAPVIESRLYETREER